MTRNDLYNILFTRLGLSRADAELSVKLMFAAMSDALANGEEIKIANFGVFDVRMRAARPGRNPRTGESVPIPPRRVVTFRLSSKLEEELNGGAPCRDC